MTNSLPPVTPTAMALYESRMKEMEQRVEELEEALRNLVVMLPSDVPGRPDDERIPAGFIYIRWIDVREARSILNKETAK